MRRIQRRKFEWQIQRRRRRQPLNHARPQLKPQQRKWRPLKDRSPLAKRLSGLRRLIGRSAAALMVMLNRTGYERKRNCSKLHRPRSRPDIRRSCVDNSLADSAVSCGANPRCAMSSQLIQPLSSQPNGIGLREASRLFVGLSSEDRRKGGSMNLRFSSSLAAPPAWTQESDPKLPLQPRASAPGTTCWSCRSLRWISACQSIASPVQVA